MALIVEDGSIVVNANSYVNVTYARSYAADREFDLPSSDDQLEAYLIRALDYIESYSERFKGSRVDEDQELSWPRDNVYIGGFLVPYTSIPKELKDLQSQLAVDINSGFDLMESTNEPFVTREMVGTIRVDYATGINTTTRLVRAESFLSHLISGYSTLSVKRF